MGTNYLKKYYLDDAKLAQRARLEFFRALDTGRMIAFVGSMATQAFGYGSWDQLRLTFTALALDALSDVSIDKQAKIDRILDFHIRGTRRYWDGQVGMSLIEEVLDSVKLTELGAQLNLGSRGQSKNWSLDHYTNVTEAMRVALADRFRGPRNAWRIDRPGFADPTCFDEEYNVPDALWHKLGIRRFATPSYDFELERVSMLADETPPDQKLYRQSERSSPFDELVELRTKGYENFSWDLGSGRIRRSFSDGWAIESDLLNRERIDRLIEFGVGTDDVDAHIMHLHGRACTPKSMIVTQRDYDNLYRREDLNRRPFEFAKRMMMGGNPILFVGLGMNEAELNKELQEFISNNPYQRVAPTFLLWSARTGKGLNKMAREAKRVDLLRRLGILTIFDSDLLEDNSDKNVLTGVYETSSDQEQMENKKYNVEYENIKKALNKINKVDGSLLINGNDYLNIKLEEVYEIQIFKNLTDSMQGSSAFKWDIADEGWKLDLRKLNDCVKLLERKTKNGEKSAYLDPSVREEKIGTHWRSMEKLVNHYTTDEATVLWEVLEGDTEGKINDPDESKWIKGLAKKCDNNIVCIIGQQGCGKGYAARQLMKNGPQKFGSTAKQTMLINGCFSFDTDSLLDATARFLGKCFDHKINTSQEKPIVSRARLFENIKLGMPSERWLTSRALIIINGSERFFDVKGRPLSAELDELLTSVMQKSYKSNIIHHRKAKAQWIIFGTERVRKYMVEVGAQILEFDEIYPTTTENRLKSTNKIPSFYLNEVYKNLSGKSLSPALENAVERYKANMSGRISGDSIELRRALFGEIFDESILIQKFKTKSAVRMVREILKALAFIGQPVEADILKLMPGIKSKNDNNLFSDTLKTLVDKRIVLQCRGYIGAENEKNKRQPDKRYVLHRALLTELRHRFGIPLSEAKLSTAFNMSLYVAQPIDGDIPDVDIHDELGVSIDELIGAYRHVPDENADLNAFNKLRKLIDDKNIFYQILETVINSCGSSRKLSDEEGESARIKLLNEATMLCGKRHVRALRTALALIRSYYSTSGLLTLDSGDRLIREGTDGVLLEHAERLNNLIDAYGKNAIARETMRMELINLNEAQGLNFFNEVFDSSEPFYPDELVWLHNELGVVRLAMGDLYEAKKSLDQAMKVNREWVERNDQAHNWRRMRLNQLSVDIEMGEMAVAERKCDEIRRISEKSKMLREDQLAVALVDGFKGWIENLRGRRDQALPYYEAASKALSDLGEVRAQAYFERLHANAIGSSDEIARKSTLERALDLAESAVQMDIVHRLRIAKADAILFSKVPTSVEERHRAHRYLEEAHVYSLHTDVHRVRLESAMCTARARLFVSDFEGALRFIMDAMMIATRYGMELRKITLRAVIAQIMAARGHPVTAENLARTCIKMATRLRFQTAIDKASQVIIDIPRISAAISRSDHTGRRNY